MELKKSVTKNGFILRFSWVAMLRVSDSFERTLITGEDSASTVYPGIYRWCLEISISSYWANGKRWFTTLNFTYYSFQNDSSVVLLSTDSLDKCWLCVVLDQHKNKRKKIFSKQNVVWDSLNLSHTCSSKSFLLVSFAAHYFLFPSDFANVDCSVSHISFA